MTLVGGAKHQDLWWGESALPLPSYFSFPPYFGSNPFLLFVTRVAQSCQLS